MTYTLADIEKLKGKIADELPEARVEDWRDYGWTLEVSIGDRHCVACRPEVSQEGQREIFLDIPQIRHLLTAH